MAVLELSLFLLTSVLISSVVSQFLPRISTPLIQIALGVVIACFMDDVFRITLDPELFLVLFIAPLLYDEAREADLGALWHYRGPILGYAIGLVLVIVAAVGFFVNWLVPAIPLAAALALGAALGPTDAVAVASLSKNPAIPNRIKSLLKGEALLNDASGLVSFQFAVAAAVLGTFSLADAAEEFAVAFFGGLILGGLLGFLTNFIIEKVRETGLENTTFHVLFEICIPLIVFTFAEEVGVSGVIAVVLCGITNAAAPRQTGPAYARTSIVSSSVWKVITFTLNGIVFVLLGTQLPSAMRTTWESAGIGYFDLILMVLAITAILELVRFLWSLALEIRTARRFGESLDATTVRDALILTLSGAKGTITLSIMFTLPIWADVSTGTPFPQRDLLIFLSCGVILCTFVIATFAVPLLAPTPKEAVSDQEQHLKDTEAYLEILRLVIETLTERQTPETVAATRSVVRSYNDRMTRIKESHDLEDEADVELQVRIIEWKEAYVFELMATGETSAEVGYRLLNRLARRKNLLEHHGESSLRDAWSRLRNSTATTVNRLRKQLPLVSESQMQEEYRQLVIRTTNYAIDRLQDTMATSSVPSEKIAGAILSQQRFLRPILSKMPSISTIARTIDAGDEIEVAAYRAELGFLKQYLDDGLISRPYAKRARENITIMQLDMEDRL